MRDKSGTLAVVIACVILAASLAGLGKIYWNRRAMNAADAAAASRFARLAGGCPGLALAYARAPEAARLRGEIARGLIDLLAASRHERLTSVRSLMRSAAALEAALAEGRKNGAGDGESSGGAGTRVTSRRRKKGASTAVQPARDAEEEEAGGDGGSSDGDGNGASGSGTGKAAEAAAPKVSASERRAAASTLTSIWASVARDLAVAALGGRRQLHDPELLDELAAVAPAIAPGTLPAFIARLGAIEAQLDENVNPELALDVLALAWPRSGRAARPAASPAA